jgi:glycosyltransferase involved in cell wall biosynthesis
VKNHVETRGKPTVAHFMPWSGLGGVEIATLRMADITREHIRSVVFCLPDAFAVKQAFENAGIETRTYISPEPSLRHALHYYRASRAVAVQIQEADADIVHFAEEKAAYHNSLAARLAGSKIMCHLRVSNPTLDLRQKLCLLPVQSFICVSKEVKQSFAVPLSDRNARVIYDALQVPAHDPSEEAANVRQELGIPLDCFVIGMVARVSPQKDYFTLAAAAKQIVDRYPNTRFLVVGDNSDVDLNRRHYLDVMKRLTELNLTEHFIFTGHRSDVSRLIAAMDVCALVTHREGFPLSILETMALKKPIVATAVGGIPEIVVPGKTGYLHRHGDSDELALGIFSLMESPDRGKQLGINGYEEVRANFSIQRFSNEILKAYSDLMRL